MEMSNLFKNTFYLLITRVIKFFVGFIRTKLVAVYLGTYGTGIIAQINQLTELMARFTVSGMSDGLVKEIAESDKNDEKYRETISASIKTYMSIILVSIIIVISLAFLFKKKLTDYFFGDINFTKYFLIGVMTFPILVINGISFAVLRSFKQIKYIARSELIGLILNLIIFVPLIYFWRLFGAAIYIAIAYITILLLNQYYANTIVLKNINLSIKDVFKAKVSRKIVKDLFVFAGFGMTAGLTLIATDSITRSTIVNKLGIEHIGIYSPVMIWTSLFVGLILPSIYTYLYPRYCECKSDNELVVVMNDSLRFVTILMIPFILISVPVRYQIISAFYSKQFLEAGLYLPWHLLGTLFYMWMYVFDQAMKPTGRIKTGGVIIILMCLIDISVVYLLVPKLGLYAFMLKYLISPVIIFVLYMIYWKHAIEYKPEMKNIILMSYIILAFMILMVVEKYLTSNYKINLVLGIALSGLSILLLSKEEKTHLINKIKTVIANKRQNKNKILEKDRKDRIDIYS